MKSVTLILLLAEILLTQGIEPFNYDLDDAPKLFDVFVKDFKKVYKDDKDKENHFEEFKKNLKILNHVNAKISTTKFDYIIIFRITLCTDLNVEEMKAMFGP